MSRTKLNTAIHECITKEGDVYDKAAILLRELIQKHPFANGNRRTAFTAVKYFIDMNNSTFGIQPSKSQPRVLVGIREGYYIHQEIKEWFKNGKIREFKR
jgi:death-on-curing family protein